MGPQTTEIERLRVKIMVQHHEEPKAEWEVAELSKNTLVLRSPVHFTALPSITIWMRALGRDAWRAFQVRSLCPANPGPCATFGMEVEDQVEFSRCFDFSRLAR